MISPEDGSRVVHENGLGFLVSDFRLCFRVPSGHAFFRRPDSTSHRFSSAEFPFSSVILTALAKSSLVVDSKQVDAGFKVSMAEGSHERKFRLFYSVIVR